MPSYTLTVNDVRQSVDVAADTPLLWVLRDALGLTGTKYGCGMGQCGACTVHIEGTATRSCMTPVASVGAKKILTIEGLAALPLGARLQQAWIDEQVPQCGYCQSGQILAAAALLSRRGDPSDAEIDRVMSAFEKMWRRLVEMVQKSPNSDRI